MTRTTGVDAEMTEMTLRGAPRLSQYLDFAAGDVANTLALPVSVQDLQRERRAGRAVFVLVPVAIMAFYPLAESRFAEMVAGTARRRLAQVEDNV